MGGVGCNERLQQMIGLMVEERGGKMGAIDERYAIDNGAMIAYAAVVEYLATKKETKLEDSWITQRFRTDELLVTWRND